MSPKILVLEDNNFIRLSVSTALYELGLPITIVEGSAEVALAKAKQAIPDVAILDLHLGLGPTGLDVAVALRKLNLKMGIIFLTSYEDPRLLNPSLPSPPAGSVYLVKNAISDMSELRFAVKTAISQGETKKGNGLGGELGRMSDSQIETLRLVAQGLSNSEIAKRRFITERSVELAISRLAKRLGLVSTPDFNHRIRLARIYFRSIGLTYEE